MIQSAFGNGVEGPSPDVVVIGGGPSGATAVTVAPLKSRPGAVTVVTKRCWPS